VGEQPINKKVSIKNKNSFFIVLFLVELI